MDTDYVRNPQTGRLVKIGSMTYRKLINNRVIKNTRRDPNVVYKLDDGDDINAIKADLKKKIKLKKGETLRKGTGKNKGKIIKSFVGGRYKKDPESSGDDDDEFETLCKKLDVSFPQNCRQPQQEPSSESEQESAASSDSESDSDE